MSGHLEPKLIHVIPQLRKLGSHRGELICAHHERNALINFFSVLSGTPSRQQPHDGYLFSCILLAILH